MWRRKKLPRNCITLESSEEQQQEFSREEIWRYLLPLQEERLHVQGLLVHEKSIESNVATSKEDGWWMRCRCTKCHRRRRVSVYGIDERAYRLWEWLDHWFRVLKPHDWLSERHNGSGVALVKRSITKLGQHWRNITTKDKGANCTHLVKCCYAWTSKWHWCWWAINDSTSEPSEKEMTPQQLRQIEKIQKSNPKYVNATNIKDEVKELETYEEASQNMAEDHKGWSYSLEAK